MDNNKSIIDFLAKDDNSILFKLKQKVTGQTGNDGTKDVEIMVPLKYLSNFWKTHEMPLANCEINRQLKWSAKCFLVAGTVANQVPTFTITDTKLYIPVVTLSTQDNVKHLKQLEYSFKRAINWDKYQSKITDQVLNQYLDFLIDPSFQGVNRLLVLSYENEND